jgi:hypothetical protein
MRSALMFAILDLPVRGSEPCLSQTPWDLDFSVD